MKPCTNNRELLAALALGALDARQERWLRAHLETCEGCRRYLEEIAKVTEKLAAAEIRQDIQTSEIFHQKVAHRLRAEAAATFWDSVVAYLRPTGFTRQNRKQRLLTPALSSAEKERERTSARPGSWIVSRLVLPVIGATVIVIAIGSLFVRRPGVSLPPPAAPQFGAASNAKGNLEPSISNYQMAANRSLEQLDELLARQGNRNSSPTPIYTASTLARAKGPD